MSKTWKSKLSWWPVILLLVVGYILPVYQIWLLHGLLAGVISIVALPVVVFDRKKIGASQVFILIVWLAYAAMTVVTMIGWSSVIVFLAWAVIAFVLKAGFILFGS